MSQDYKTGEELARKCLEANGYLVIDRRESPEYWRKDIDYTVSRDGISFDIEVKWDYQTHDRGTMFFELLTDIQEMRIGWANYTEADFIFYGDAQGQRFYIFSVEDMRAYIKTHKGEYSIVTADDKNKRTNQIIKQSLGAIVPIEGFRQFYKVQEIDITDRLKNRATERPL